MELDGFYSNLIIFITRSWLLRLTILCVVLWYSWRQFYNNRMLPPSYGRFFPIVGCSIEFGKEPLNFIEEMSKKLGSVFTLHVAGKKLTFLTNPEDFSAFFENSDFQSTVQPVVWKTANIPKGSFQKYHDKMHTALKGKLALQNLPHIGAQLCEKFSSIMRKWDHEMVHADLYQLVRSSMYHGVIEQVFGEKILPVTNESDFERLVTEFVEFDEGFEYGSQLPEMFLNRWKKAKYFLLGVMEKAVPNIYATYKQDGKNNTVLQAILNVLDGDNAPNFALLVLWASLANAIPITFWAIVYISNNPKIMKKVQEEIEQLNKTSHDSLASDLKRIPTIKCAVLETIRLHPPGAIARMVTTPLKVRGYTISRGHQLMLSPFWVHRNPRTFQSPNEFKPERWLGCDEKNLLTGFVAFGGGRYQCPGRWFALMEIQLYVALFFTRYSVELKHGIPQFSYSHLVGTQQPTEKCPVLLTRRKQ